jgi:FtsP/CotA-like multicopper oxidase with cupredoxin domain
VIVHFKNSLPEDTSVHWHGLRISNDMDGVPGFTMEPVHSGGEFTYDFVVPDAGTFWYHPHVDNSAAQLGRGLYGPLVVEDPNEPKGLGDELILVFSDMSLTPDGQFEPADSGGSAGNLFGREGTVLLVNGKVQPKLKVRQGKPQRWRIINTTRSRYYTLRYKRAPLVKIGGDGGLAARPQTVDEIKLVPSERLDIVFTPPDAPGSTNPFRWYATNRGYGSTYYRVPEDIMTIETVNEPPVQAAPVPAELRKIEPLDLTNAIQREINLTIGFDRDKKVVMGINGIPHSHAVPIMAKVGDTEVWTINNDTDFSHPFHLHGFFFQVLGDDQIPQWKDTVDVPFKSSLKIAVHFDNRPGMWMYHCHILDHAEAGMMGHLHVMP